MYNDLQESLNLNVKMLNLNVNFWVSGGSRMIYKKVVHFKFKFRGIFLNSRNICDIVNSDDLLQYRWIQW